MDATSRTAEDSLAGGVSEYVSSIMRAAEHEAAAIVEEARRESDRLLGDAHAQAARRRTQAVREAEALAGAQIARILELRSAIRERGPALARAAGEHGGAAAALEALSDALAERADLIAREASGRQAQAPAAPAPVAAQEPVAPAAPAPVAEPLAPAVSEGAQKATQEPAAAPASSAQQATALEVPAAPDAPVERGSRRYDEVHLHALRRAIAGTTRLELEREVTTMLESSDAATAVLDDVFGPAVTPFPRWTEARRSVPT